MVHVSTLLSVLALGALVTAAPPPVPKASKAATTAPAAKATKSALFPFPLAKTTAPAPEATGKITIPEDVIDAAPIEDIPTGNTLASIPGVVSNSTLVTARPDLQEYVDTANSTGNATALPKPGLNKRSEDPWNCNPNQDASLEVSTKSWERLAKKVCKKWYDESTFQYDPSSPTPNSLKSSSVQVNVGGGRILTFTFTYGVNDWGTQMSAGWQPFYVPQSRQLCIADLKTLIAEMSDVCLYYTGYDTSQSFYGTGQPKWYTFTAS